MYSLLITSLILSMVNGCRGVRCGGGDACIFMGRAHDPPWIAFTDSTEASKANIVPPSSESWKYPNASLFISIASFRDSLCPVTLFNIFTKAKFPSRITVGIVQQNAPEDVDCVEEFCDMMMKKENDASCGYKSNIRITRIDASLARGPTFGRALGSKLLQNEEFCMQTDAHMDMVRHWDVKMMDMWGLIQNEYAILSTYVTDAAELPVLDKEDSKGINNLHEVPHLCMVHFSGTYDLVRNTDTKCARMLPRPKLNNIVWGAGLSFSKCHAERKVPYDPHTPGIFDGEEFNRGLRFWTYGYDVYTPHRVYVVHNYKKSQSDPKHAAWIMNKAASKEEDSFLSAARLKTIFGYSSGGIADAKEAERVLRSKYGLGDRRTLDQAIAFSGIDTRSRRLIANKCGNLDYVPFVPHPWGSDYVPAFDPVTEDLIEAIYDPGSIYFQPSMLERWEELDAAHSRMNSQPTGSLILLKADVLVHEIQVDMPEDYLSNARVHTFILMGALLFIFGVFAFFYSHLFHYGKDHKEVARNDTERYIKTV